MEILTTEQREGYELRTIRYAADEGGPCEAVGAFTPAGHFIGDERDARHLIEQLGIAPELRVPENETCSIGFCAREQRWYGWSHRAIAGFGVGDVAKEGDACTEPGVTAAYLALHPEANIAVPVGFVARTLDDAKRMACAFAESVS